ncbi:MAG: HAMP domain-containing sensor histidine kinase [Clostridiales bacterium]|nr:HAMP domain-containing sensor histidine kinase [Clostridiales bacterium]
MGNLIEKKLLRNSILSAILLTSFFGFILVISIQYQKLNIAERTVRVDVNLPLYEMEQGTQNQMSTQTTIPYCIFDLDGTVMESTIKTYQPLQKIDLHKIGSLKTYLVPIQTQSGTKLVLFDCSSYEQKQLLQRVLNTMILPTILYLASLVIIRKRYQLEKREILAPLEELHSSTKSILQGNLQMPVKYDYDGEIGTLCHDFELMREELEDSFQREVLSKEKERALYASISHDLKTPLATITGYIEEILYGVAQSPDQINEYAERMLNKAVVLNKLIDDILDHAKSQLNQLSIQTSEVYALNFFKPMLQEFQEDVKRRNGSLTYELPKNVLLEIDSYRITQVLQNLIDNAIKYGHEHTNIQVSFTLMDEPVQQLIVQVQDDGRGIDAADLPFIFDMFYRGNKARTFDIPGSGLGLNIAKYIVEQHGGQMECDSIVGIGTTISFSLPAM